jgi:hypothetical protein
MPAGLSRVVRSEQTSKRSYKLTSRSSDIYQTEDQVVVSLVY